MAKDQVIPEGMDSQYPGNEIWKPVPSEPGVHVSNWGRVLLAPGYVPLPNGGYRLYQPEPRFGQIAKSKKGAQHEYRIVMVKRQREGGRQSPRKVHQLVCEAFHGPKPFPEAVVLHLDEDGLNNRPENLRWGTQKENLNMPGFVQYCRTRPHPSLKSK
ncbi:HNH endonuclease signature motif containing protein [Paracoccus sp. SY]|uniref:HNH endonuclease signature motif containing protein n=1 Tax=Paracoccus sp. SY TaxID=1330255 RepID=UPI00195F7AA0|nr:HNH endonuclease signature motif containing protein [Paracoccus sp. SY]